MTDPRLTGTLSITGTPTTSCGPTPRRHRGAPGPGSRRGLLSEREGYEVGWGTWLLTADDGTWEGDFTGSSTSAESMVGTGWLKGTGAYEGLSASVQMVVASLYWPKGGEVSALIFPGNPPPDR